MKFKSRKESCKIDNGPFLVAAVWRQEELARINSTFTGAERKAALCELLAREAQLIASIGRHKLNADEENEQKAILSFLEKVSEIISS